MTKRYRVGGAMSDFQKFHAILIKCVEEYFRPHLNWNKPIVGVVPDGHILLDEFKRKFCKEIADRFNHWPDTPFRTLEFSKEWIETHKGDTVIDFVSDAALEATEQAGRKSGA